MNRDAAMRPSLVLAAIFNFSAAAMILFPASIGRVADLPVSTPRFNSWLLAFLVALFGGVYAWLSRSPIIDRPLVAIAIIGKIGVFLVALSCLVLGDISARSFAPAVGDLLFALIFVWWYCGTRPRADSRAGF